MTVVHDPRPFPPVDPGRLDPLLEATDALLDAATSDVRSTAQRALEQCLENLLDADRAADIARAIECAPSVAAARALWRVLAAVVAARDAATLRLEPFALPVVLVAGAARDGDSPGAIRDAARVAKLLGDAGIVGGSESIALGAELVGPSQLTVEAALSLVVPGGVEARAARLRSLELSPMPLRVKAGHEQAHLRFLVGMAIVAPHVDPFARPAGKAAMAVTRELATQLAGPVTVLPLAGLPMRPFLAIEQGRRSQRDVAVQLFVASALRDLRLRAGEPTAVISAHRVRGAGELRLCLSSPLADARPEGFRYPLCNLDRIEEVEQSLLRLLEQCRVGDVRVLGGMFPDRDPDSGRLLLFDVRTVEAAGSLAVQ